MLPCFSIGSRSFLPYIKVSLPFGNHGWKMCTGFSTLRIAAPLSQLPRRSAFRLQVCSVDNYSNITCGLWYGSHICACSWDVLAHCFEADSIDYNDPKGAVSWEIDVVLEREVMVPSLAALYSKYLPKLRDFVAEQKVKMTNGDTAEPILDWVFIRKYAGRSLRSNYTSLSVSSQLF